VNIPSSITRSLHRSYLDVFPQGLTITPRAHGIDLSKYDLHFQPTTAPGQLEFVIQRISYRTTRDEAFDALVAGVMQVPVRGGYHYLNSDTDWRLQADKFMGYVAGLDYHFFACDFESAYNTMSAAYAKQAWDWIHYVQQKTGKPVLLYTSLDLYTRYISPSQKIYGIDWNTVPLWTAQWFLTPNPNGTPTLPPGRTSWTLWQYTDQGDGPLYGTARPTACDLDVFNGTPLQMREMLNIGDVTPPPTGESMTKYYRLNTTAANIRTGVGTSYPDKGDLAKGDVVQVDESPVGGWSPYKLAQHADGSWVKLADGTPLDTTNQTKYWSTNAYFVEVAGLPKPVTPPVEPPVSTLPDLPYVITLGDDITYTKATISGVLKPK
jgi:hypothetical protein